MKIVQVALGVIEVIIILAMLLVTARYRMEVRDVRHGQRVRRGWELWVYRAGGWIGDMLDKPFPGGG